MKENKYYHVGAPAITGETPELPPCAVILLNHEPVSPKNDSLTKRPSKKIRRPNNRQP